MKYTIETRLYEKQNKDLIEYFDSVVNQYNYVFRVVWHRIKHNPIQKNHILNTQLQNEFNITKRTAGSIIKTVVGRYSSLKALKEYELKQSEIKLYKLEQNLIVEQNKLGKQKILAKNNQIKDFQTYKNLKTKVSWMKISIDKLKNKIESLKNQINTNRFKITFGTFRLLKQDTEQFLRQRDSQVCAIGTKSEKCGNSNFQLLYNKKNNQFSIKVRKDFNGNKQLKGDCRYVLGQCYFNHLKKELINILKTKNLPLTYRVIKRVNKYYLQCVLEIEKKSITRKSYGVIGIDFNKGFLAVSETNECGSLIYTDRLNYRFKQGNKTENDLLQCINHLVKKALIVGKDLVIESLDFSKKKSLTTKAKSSNGKKYNDMLHSLAYRMFIDRCEQICNRNGVGLIKVNPAWTSWIADKKYCKTMKLNIHIGASYVIARRGMGYKEKKIK